MRSAGLSARYERMWRVSFLGSTVEGDVEAMQVGSVLQKVSTQRTRAVDSLLKLVGLDCVLDSSYSRSCICVRLDYCRGVDGGEIN